MMMMRNERAVIVMLRFRAVAALFVIGWTSAMAQAS